MEPVPIDPEQKEPNGEPQPDIMRTLRPPCAVTLMPCVTVTPLKPSMSTSTVPSTVCELVSRVLEWLIEPALLDWLWRTLLEVPALAVSTTGPLRATEPPCEISRRTTWPSAVSVSGPLMTMLPPARRYISALPR